MVSSAITNDFFIRPGQNVELEQDRDGYMFLVNMTPTQLCQRWHSSSGQQILTSWEAQGFSREVLERQVGQIYGYIDLRGIPLVGKTLKNVDLSKVELFRADLSRSTFDSVNFDHSHFSEAKIQGTSFRYCSMREILIDNAEFDSGTTFTGIDLNSINFTLAILLKDAVTNQQRITDLERYHPVLATVLRATSDYGRSFFRFFAWCLGAIVLFGVIYIWTGGINASGFIGGVYYSASVFFGASVAITPLSVTAKVMTLVERAIAYLSMGLLVTIMIRRTIS